MHAQYDHVFVGKQHCYLYSSVRHSYARKHYGYSRLRHYELHDNSYSRGVLLRDVLFNDFGRNCAHADDRNVTRYRDLLLDFFLPIKASVSWNAEVRRAKWFDIYAA